MEAIGTLVGAAFGQKSNTGLPFGRYLHSSPSRQRTLTGPLDPTRESFWHKIQVLSTYEREQQTYLQQQCAFLSRLPLDVRMMIYELVLGGMTFHITTNEPAKTRILSYLCKRPHRMGDGTHQVCYASDERRPSSAPRYDYPQATGLLPLLVTCRRVYSEAIETLYSANIFDVWANRVAMGLLKGMIPPQRLRCIRCFRWDMQLPHHPSANARSLRDWTDLFDFFANGTTGLQLLHIKLNRHHPVEAVIEQTPDDQAQDWLEPMVVMAMNAARKRGCKVELLMNGVVHEPNEIFRAVVKNHRGDTFDSVMAKTCTELHRRIRLSLDVP